MRLLWVGHTAWMDETRK